MEWVFTEFVIALHIHLFNDHTIIIEYNNKEDVEKKDKWLMNIINWEITFFFMYQLTNVFIERHWNLKLSLLNIVCVGVTYVGKE